MISSRLFRAAVVLGIAGGAVVVACGGCLSLPASVEVSGSGVTAGLQVQSLHCAGDATLERYASGAGPVRITIYDGSGAATFDDHTEPQIEPARVFATVPLGLEVAVPVLGEHDAVGEVGTRDHVPALGLQRREIIQRERQQFPAAVVAVGEGPRKSRTQGSLGGDVAFQLVQDAA